MRTAILFLAISISLAACHQPSHQSGEKAKAEQPSTGNFGETPAAQQAIPASQLAAQFTDADTIDVIISGDIAASCKHSGCWMDIDMGNSSTVHVTFEEEKFTIPLDAAGKKAIAKGKAVRELIPVETLRNYARDEGKSEEEVALITEPAWNYEMIATGVLIEE